MHAAEWDVNDGEENLMRECLIEGVKTAAAEVISCDALILGGVKPWLLACVCFGYGQTEAIHGIMGRAVGRIREGQRAGKGKTRKLRYVQELKRTIRVQCTTTDHHINIIMVQIFW